MKLQPVILACDVGGTRIKLGLVREQTLDLTGLRRHVARHAWTPWGKVKIKPAALGNDAGMFGVASLFQDAK